MILESEWVLPITSPALHGGAILVQEGAILEVGPAQELRERHPGEEVTNFHHAVLMPGFVNAHVHLEYSLFRGLLDDCNFGDWMLQFMKSKRRLERKDYLPSALLGAMECVSSGITTIADTVFDDTATLQAVDTFGLRAYAFLETFGMDDLKKHDVAVAHCPKSNAKLGGGIAPISDFQEAGLRVGLGTDSLASNNILDMFHEMRMCIFLQRAHKSDARCMSAQQALELATMGGAQVLGMEEDLGSLEPGKRADVIAVDMEYSQFSPIDDPVSALVYGANQQDVFFTMVDGEVIYDKKAFLRGDVADIIREADVVRAKIRA